MCSGQSALLQAVLPVTNKTECRFNDTNQIIHTIHFVHHISHIKWPATELKVLLSRTGKYLSELQYSLTIFVSVHLLSKINMFNLEGSHNAMLHSLSLEVSIMSHSRCYMPYHCCDNLKTHNIITLFLVAYYNMCIFKGILQSTNYLQGIYFDLLFFQNNLF